MQSTLASILMITLCCLAATGCTPRVRKVKVVSQTPDAPAGKLEGAAPSIKKAAKPPAADKKGAVEPWIVEGWGKTEEDAKKDAERKVREKLLVDLKPPLLWTPPPGYVLNNLFNGPGERCPNLDQLIGDEKVQCWAWKVSLDRKQIDALRQQDAIYRADLDFAERSVLAKRRMEKLGKLLGLVVLCLAGIAAYLHLDRWLQGSRRRWLRIALTGAVAATGAGWWFLS
jgi:hypothetical protein